MHGPGPIGADVERSMRRSRLRKRVLLTLSSLGEAHPGHLAAACGLTPTRLRWVLHGHWPEYNPDLSLVALHLAEEVRTPHGRVYRITSRGRRKARSISKAWLIRRAKVDEL